jgi:hypothetical protein
MFVPSISVQEWRRQYEVADALNRVVRYFGGSHCRNG